MRHAESGMSANTDHERTLTLLGRHNAQKMGKLLDEMGIGPDAVLCSTAQRTRETLTLFLEEHSFSGEPQYLDGLYNAQITTYIDALAKLPADIETVMIVGHNPTISSAFEFFSQRPNPFYPATIGYLGFEIDNWGKLIENSEGELLGYWTV